MPPASEPQAAPDFEATELHVQWLFGDPHLHGLELQLSRCLVAQL